MIFTHSQAFAHFWRRRIMLRHARKCQIPRSDESLQKRPKRSQHQHRRDAGGEARYVR